MIPIPVRIIPVENIITEIVLAHPDMKPLVKYNIIIRNIDMNDNNDVIKPILTKMRSNLSEWDVMPFIA